MQSCGRAARRSACGALNAYSPANALRSTFATTSKRRQDEETVPSQVARNSHNGKKGRSFNKILANTPDDALGWIDKELTREQEEGVLEERYVGRVTGPRALVTSNDDWQPFIARLRDRRASLRTQEGRKKLLGLSEEQKDILRKSFDYVPLVILPHQSKMRKMPIPWALTDAEKGRLKGTGHLLSEELRRFEQYMTPTFEESAARRAIAEELKDFITTTLLDDEPGKTGFEIFGSEKTGLAAPLSDIDVRVFDTTDREAMPLRMGNRMEFLFTRLRRSDKYVLTTLRKMGRFPIINCQHRESGIDIQIVASPATSRQQEITTRYLALTPHLRPLFYVFRTILAMRGLLDVWSGGLGSYGSFIMLFATINRELERSARVDPGHRDDFLASHFRRFLRFYADDKPEYSGMVPSKHGIAVGPRLKFLKHDADPRYNRYSQLALKRGDPIRAAQWMMCQRNPLQPYLLTLQDPADPRNDLGKKTNAIKHILATINHYRHMLNKKLKDVGAHRATGKTWPEESILMPFVGRCHEVYAAPRKKLSDYGRRILDGDKKDSKEQEQERARLGQRQKEEERKEVEMMRTAEAFAATDDALDEGGDGGRRDLGGGEQESKRQHAATATATDTDAADQGGHGGSKIRKVRVRWLTKFIPADDPP
ncbi:Terminal nucleotidyltransferase 4A [Fulvia fulva]|uniref:Terminal nucleotidyltransferase 4A n=1 Tax=Passalora fulva TaxID=5499 RepID=A0A9Q8PFH1_PASFU|nr:Terminal nucleotidyltransferase 4A [Fulvia fulva]KAK4614175.1 Terminal nucleotidyltransferase 4A [Fulvia fulva]KAK4614442.1 Terminal nucleotidyltransferase 4A [Fulvia fulva]UJO21629.1 Terminal nucleotidyltransferase 4A [Fulvia fulva]WPV20739.1 Terminal nucleotidyltransferase 4A [Fulvia fulva]WPV34979.1 Terminal nucleotidyltransferase 4A [Fulvia fulva]